MVGAARDKDIAVGQQRRTWPATPGCHLRDDLKLAGLGIVQLSRAVEVLVAAHTACYENPPIRQKGRAVARAWLQHGCDRGHRSEARGRSGRSDGGGCN